MATFFDRVKNIFGVTDEEYYDDYAEQDEFITYNNNNEQEDVRSSSREPLGRQNKVVNIHTTAQLQVVLAKPEKFEDASSVADHLNERRTVVLNLESANRDIARRLVDFLSGVAYANGGQIKRVANSTFIITPYNVDVMGDLLDELENSGMFFQ
ncbi:MAG: cell division protein SepF [Oscillospiraceae bacterium]|jgi:cell division inhibitor SepF|nr:cell division protein SepF [Oscillospiraceae bacterium]